MNKPHPKHRKARGKKGRGRGRGPGKSGNPKRQADHYRSLAQQAMSDGDRVMAEHYYQHMDHYMRLLNGNGDAGQGGHDNKKQSPRHENKNARSGNQQSGNAPQQQAGAQA